MKREVIVALLFSALAFAAACVDVTNAGRDVVPNPPLETGKLLPPGAACTADAQCQSGNCLAASGLCQ